MRKYAALITSLLLCLALTLSASAVETESVPVFRFGKVQDKVVAITFDDGPDTFHTQAILDYLAEENVVATFFVIGVNAEKCPDLVKKEVAAGHEIGLHTYTHKDLTGQSKKEVEDELQRSASLLENLLSDKPQLFRPPGGVCTENVKAAARELGYRMVLWSVDPRDWSDTTEKEITRTVLGNTKPGSVILFHDYKYGDSGTLPALKQIIPALKADGYRFVTVTQLMQLSENDR